MIMYQPSAMLNMTHLQTFTVLGLLLTCIKAYPSNNQYPFEAISYTTLPPRPTIAASSRPSSQSEAAMTSSNKIPPLNPAAFSTNHTLIELNDGTFVPSPAFGVGTAWFGKDAEEAVEGALKVGYRHLDNAAVYGNELSVGKAIKESGLKREELYITSKYDHLDGKDVETEFQESLKKLGVDYLDLYLLHHPRVASSNPLKVWRAMESLVERSLVRSIGVSNYGITDLTPLLSYTHIPPAVNQIRYHPYNTLQMDPVVKFGELNGRGNNGKGITTAAYSALTPLTKEPGGPIDSIISKLSDKKNMTEGQIILEWVKQKGVLVVTTSGKEYRQKEQLEIFGKDYNKKNENSLTKKETEMLEEAGKKGELEKKLPGGNRH